MYSIHPNVCINSLGTLEQPYKLAIEEAFQKPSSQLPANHTLLKIRLPVLILPCTMVSMGAYWCMCWLTTLEPELRLTIS